MEAAAPPSTLAPVVSLAQRDSAGRSIGALTVPWQAVAALTMSAFSALTLGSA
jgi:hypothetical protein